MVGNIACSVSMSDKRYETITKKKMKILISSGDAALQIGNFGTQTLG